MSDESDLLRDSKDPQLPNDDLLPEFDRTQEKYWKHWLLAPDEQVLGCGEASATLALGHPPGRVLWTAPDGELTVTSQRILMVLHALHRATDGSKAFGGTYGQVRHEWIKQTAFFPGGMMKPFRVELDAAYIDGTPAQYRFAASRKHRQVIEAIDPAIRAWRPDGAAVPLGHRLAPTQ